MCSGPLHVQVKLHPCMLAHHLPEGCMCMHTGCHSNSPVLLFLPQAKSQKLGTIVLRGLSKCCTELYRRMQCLTQYPLKKFLRLSILHTLKHLHTLKNIKRKAENMFSQTNKLLITFQIGATSGKHRCIIQSQNNEVLSLAPLFCNCAPTRANCAPIRANCAQ
uniref:Uncharacterized protein n=1 Tax=Micrurus carvalhoi TaxID=3147026 RepID=A0A2H6N6P6_9SAUR